jgi:hypothetical protein
MIAIGLLFIRIFAELFGMMASKRALYHGSLGLVGNVARKGKARIM